VIPLGSRTTGLMVWPDVDIGVDAHGLGVGAAFEAVLPLLATARCSGLEYANETGAPEGEARYYFVIHLDGWKLDLSLWTAGVPAGVEEWQTDLQRRLDDETKLTILRLKDAWHTLPPYPYTVGGYEIAVAVLEHGARTLADLDAYLAAAGLPTRAEAAPA
jgi:hypothetical protein